MVMKIEPVFRAIRKLHKPGQYIVLFTPQGKTLAQGGLKNFLKVKHLLLICGHYEGVDERIRSLVTHEVSIGDYILTGGELPALVFIDALVRLIPGVLGAENGLDWESFSFNLLEYPQYTRPAEYKGMKVPKVLLSGKHNAIKEWRKKQALKRTHQRRPDLIGD